MNIFYLDRDPAYCAIWHCDKHVVKMILESAQLLCTAQRFYGNSNIKLYKSTHVNHPCSKWARETEGNYDYLFQLFRCLCNEYSYRYFKYHASAALMDILEKAPEGIAKTNMTAPALAMPEEFKQIDPVKSYRSYYKGAKKHLLKYTKREMPYWLNQENI